MPLPRLLVFVVPLTFTACAFTIFPPRTTKLVPNPSPSNSALLCRPGDTNFHVFKIDGETPPKRMAAGNTFDGPFQDNYKVFLAPGEHTLELGWSGATKYMKEHLDMRFSVQAGRTYAVVGARTDSGFKASVEDFTGKSPKDKKKKRKWKKHCRWPGVSYGADTPN